MAHRAAKLGDAAEHLEWHVHKDLEGSEAEFGYPPGADPDPSALAAKLEEVRIYCAEPWSIAWGNPSKTSTRADTTLSRP